MVRSETKKLLALTLATVILLGSGYTYGSFHDLERNTATLNAGNVPGGAGNTITNDVGVGNVGAGNMQSGSCSAGNSAGCTMNSLAVGIDLPDAGEPRYAQVGRPLRTFNRQNSGSAVR